MVELSLIVPARNEERIIQETIEGILSVFERDEIDGEIIVVDDGSEDSTYEKASAMGYQNLKTLRMEDNLGKGMAFRTGIDHAKGRYVGFLDADLEIDPRQLPAFIRRLEESGADVIVGSKYHPDANVRYPFMRKVLSRGYVALSNLLFGLGISDVGVGLKIFRRESLEMIKEKLLVKKYAFDLEVLAVLKSKGCRMTDHPVEILAKTDSSLDWGEVFRIAVDTAAIFYRLNIIHHYD